MKEIVFEPMRFDIIVLLIVDIIGLFCCFSDILNL